MVASPARSLEPRARFESASVGEALRGAVPARDPLETARSDAVAPRRPAGQSPPRAVAAGRSASDARKNSRFIRAMFSTEIPFGHAAMHSKWLVQLPKPSASIARTID